MHLLNRHISAIDAQGAIRNPRRRDIPTHHHLGRVSQELLHGVVMVIVEDLHRRRHHQVCGCRPPSEFTTTNTTAKAIAISVLLQVVTAGGRI